MCSISAAASAGRGRMQLPSGTFDHVGSYAVTMNIADKERLGREVARVLKTGRVFLV
jgi:hypothetical protein